MTVFYRKYRPQKLSEIVGQDHITKVLLGQLESGKISHGYLFAGPRGTGKTSTARILAKAVNCQNKQLTIDKKQLTKASQRSNVKGQMLFGEPCNKCESCIAITNGSYLDLVEIDAASNRGIDEIRDLREKIKLSPISGRFKIYIIDEAHMLTNEAFNALLKTLEEPPVHAIFILCTTEEQKLPATIISRLARFNFKRAKDQDLAAAVEKIAKIEKVKIDKDGVAAIVRAADGSFRDAVSTLDQLSTSSSEIKEKDVQRIIKTHGWSRIYTFADNLASKNIRELVRTVEQIAEEGGDIALFGREIVIFLKKLLLVKIGLNMREEAETDLAKVMDLAKKFDYVDLQNLMKLFLIAEGEMKLYPLPQIPLILAICKYCPATTATTEVTEGKIATTEEIATTESTEQEHEDTEKKTATTEDTEKIDGVKNRSKTVSTVVAKSPRSLGEVEKHWGEFLAKVKPINSHVVALLRSSKPSQFDGKQLTIEVFYRFHKEKLEEPRITEMIEKVSGEVFGKKIVLKFVLAQKTAVPTKEVAMSNVADVGQDEIVKLASEIFSK
ncbi:DNA polymerase III subunit gamma/tau [Candidatus Curtissbacteria bacterium]|nr:DNA polymerase III subunit gamma/tau [Candidatus Curtissbacteria bacterium]